MSTIPVMKMPIQNTSHIYETEQQEDPIDDEGDSNNYLIRCTRMHRGHEGRNCLRNAILDSKE